VAALGMLMEGTESCIAGCCLAVYVSQVAVGARWVAVGSCIRRDIVVQHVLHRTVSQLFIAVVVAGLLRQVCG
jgi:hypothetical protein